eukprot:5463037-Pleurochrysis_carterae.AAC.1
MSSPFLVRNHQLHSIELHAATVPFCCSNVGCSLMVLRLLSARLTRRRARACGPLAGCAQVRTLEGHRRWVLSICVTPDGKHVVTGSNDKTAR